MNEEFQKVIQNKNTEVNEHFGTVHRCFEFMIICKLRKDET